MEPYCDCFYQGIERQSFRKLDQPPQEGMSYKDIKEKVEQPFSGL